MRPLGPNFPRGPVSFDAWNDGLRSEFARPQAGADGANANTAKATTGAAPASVSKAVDCEKGPPEADRSKAANTSRPRVTTIAFWIAPAMPYHCGCPALDVTP